MSDKPWFQIHLSTAMVLMLTIAIIMWLQTLPGNSFGELEQYYGFPFPAFDAYNAPDNEALQHFSIPFGKGKLSLPLLALNIVAGVFISIPIVSGLESSIRRREARAP